MIHSGVSLFSLGTNLQDASELAVVLTEEGGWSIDNAHELRRWQTSSLSRSSTPRTARTPDALERVRSAAPLDIRSMDWSCLTLAVPTEALTNPLNNTKDALQIDLNSGGRVYFCLFKPSPHAGNKLPRSLGIFSSIGAALGLSSNPATASTHPHSNLAPHPPTASSPPPLPPAPRRSSSGGGPPHSSHPNGSLMPAAASNDSICVLKFCQNRLLAMAEQLATEIARHAGVTAPESRIIHQAGPTAVEWGALEAAVEALGTAGEELQADMAAVPAALLMSYIQGSKLSSAGDVFQGPSRAQVFEDVGRIFVVDCVLGNADRLPCSDLGWRGNPSNIMVGALGSKYAGRLVAIDACVQRRPPAAKMEREDDAVDRLAQLVLTDPGKGVVLPLLRDQLLMGASQSVTRALREHAGECVAAFQRGMRAGLERVVALKGLLEMMHDHLTEWVTEFLTDMKAAAPHIRLPSPTKAKGASPPGAALAPRTQPPHYPPRRTSLPGDLHSFKEGRGARRGALLGGASSNTGGSSQQALPRLRAASNDGSPGAGLGRVGGGGGGGGGPGAGDGSRTPPPDARSRASASAWGQSPSQTPAPATGTQAPAGPPGSKRTSATGAPPPGATPPPMPRGSPPPVRTPASAPCGLAGARERASAAGARDLSLTHALKAVGAEARRDSVLSARVEGWRSKFRHHASKLKAAADEWQVRHGHSLERVLTMGFLTGAAPIVDLYELKVRLDHMLRRLRVLQEAATAAAPIHITALTDNSPTRAGPQLYLGGAVAADSHHVLRHLGITHILNATEEVALPPAGAGFTVCRVPLRDTDDEDIARHFSTAADFIDQVARGGGAASRGSGVARGSVLVHCSEGKSRSVALVVAYLVMRKRMTLANALALVRSRRPEAAPNAGFSAALVALERSELGSSSVEGPAAAHNPAAVAAQNVLAAKRARPEALRCPVCDATVGLSKESLALHLRTKHPAPGCEGDTAAGVGSHTPVGGRSQGHTPAGHKAQSGVGSGSRTPVGVLGAGGVGGAGGRGSGGGGGSSARSSFSRPSPASFSRPSLSPRPTQPATAGTPTATPKTQAAVPAAPAAGSRRGTASSPAGQPEKKPEPTPDWFVGFAGARVAAPSSSKASSASSSPSPNKATPTKSSPPIKPVPSPTKPSPASSLSPSPRTAAPSVNRKPAVPAAAAGKGAGVSSSQKATPPAAAVTSAQDAAPGRSGAASGRTPAGGVVQSPSHLTRSPSQGQGSPPSVPAAPVPVVVPRARGPLGC